MAIKPLPIHLRVLPVNRGRLSSLLPITVPDTYSTETGDYHPNGFYSSFIFGKPGTRQRMEQHAYIDLRTNVMHPKLLKDILSLKQLYKDILAGTRYAIFDPKLKDFVASDVMNGDTGYHFFISNVQHIKFKETRSPKRQKILKELEVNMGDLFMNKLVVHPAGLRELEKAEDGRDKEHELTKFYKKVLFQSNAINDDQVMKELKGLDNIRWSMQRHILNIDAYFADMSYGGNGFYEAKWGSRRIIASTRNIITSMTNDVLDVEDDNLPDINTGHMGLFQFAKSSVPQFKFGLLNNIVPQLVTEDNNGFNLIDGNTLTRKEVKVSQKTRDYWLTLSGVEKLLNAFADDKKRTSPIVIEGNNYLKLIYKDDEVFLLLDDINDLPTNLSKDKVTPLTWAELLYIVCLPLTHKGYYVSSRYPILKEDSVYVGKVSLKTTKRYKTLKQLDLRLNDTLPMKFTEFPILEEGAKFFDTFSPNPLRLDSLGGDFDGDKMQGYMVYGKEAVEEAKRLMNDLSSYLNTNGKLKHPITTDITDWVLANYY